MSTHTHTHSLKNCNYIVFRIKTSQPFIFLPTIAFSFSVLPEMLENIQWKTKCIYCRFYTIIYTICIKKMTWNLTRFKNVICKVVSAYCVARARLWSCLDTQRYFIQAITLKLNGSKQRSKANGSKKKSPELLLYQYCPIRFIDWFAQIYNTLFYIAPTRAGFFLMQYGIFKMNEATTIWWNTT